MIVIKAKILSVISIISVLFSLVTISVDAAVQSPTPSGLNDSADYLLDVPDAGNYIYYSSDWKGHGLAWTSFLMFCKNQYNPDSFNNSDRGGYIYTKTINGENFYEAELNTDASAFGIVEGCNIIAIQPMHVQFDSKAYESGESVPLGNYLDTTPYNYVAARVKIESENKFNKSVSMMLRAKGRDQYIDNMAGTYLINNKTRQIIGPYPEFKYVELESDFDGWIVMPVADMAEGKPLSELATVSFFLHSEGHKDKCSHKIPKTDWTDSTLNIGDMLLVKDIETFNKVRTSCSVLGHSYGEPVITDSTAEKKGESIYTCTVCGDKKTEYFANSLSGKSVEGLNVTAKITGTTNIRENVILKTANITDSIDTKNKNTIIRGVNSLSDKIKSRKIVQIFDFNLITRTLSADGKNVDTIFDAKGNVNLTVPIDASITKNYKNFNVVHVTNDGTATLLESSVKDSTLNFTTEKFGYFALVGGTKTEAEKNAVSSVANSQTTSKNNSVTNSSSNVSTTESSENSTISEIASSESTESKEVVADNSDNEKNKSDNKNLTLPIILITVAVIVVVGLIIAAIMLLKK